MVLRQPRQDQACELGVGRQAEIGVGAFRHTFQETGLYQQLEMPRKARLRLSQHLAQVGHAKGPRAQSASSRSRVGSAAARSCARTRSMALRMT